MKFKTLKELETVLILQELDELRNSPKGREFPISTRRDMRIFLEQERDRLTEIKENGDEIKSSGEYEAMIGIAKTIIRTNFGKNPETTEIVRVMMEKFGDDGVAWIDNLVSEKEGEKIKIEVAELKKNKKEEKEKLKEEPQITSKQDLFKKEEKEEENRIKKMLFYQPIIEEIIEEFKKQERVEEKARKINMKFDFKTSNYVVKGNQGLGKTTLIKTIHEKTKKDEPFIHITTSETISKYLGESAVKVRDYVRKVQKGTLLVSDFDGWLNQRSESGNDNALEPMRELLHLVKKGGFTLVFEGSNDEIESVFDRMPEFKEQFSKIIDIPNFQLEHLIELTKFKLDEIDIEMSEKAEEVLKNYLKQNKIKNGYKVQNIVQEMVVELLENQQEMIVTEETVAKLSDLIKKPKQTETENSYVEAVKELGRMIGQEKAKKEIKNVLNLAIVQEKRKEEGKKAIKTTRHMIFSGSPGTGKTTIARIVGKLYASAGLLDRGHFVEATIDQLTNSSNATDQIKKMVNKAEGGVLFIDEAYSLLKSREGMEVIDGLVPLLENKREDFICILAGYTDEMEDFKDANVGLESRVKTIAFEDYKKEELFEILEMILKENEYEIEEKAKEQLNKYIKEKDFNGNGRAMRNLFEKLIEIQANRIIEEGEEEYSVLKQKDIQCLYEEELLKI